MYVHRFPFDSTRPAHNALYIIHGDIFAACKSCSSSLHMRAPDALSIRCSCCAFLNRWTVRPFWPLCVRRASSSANSHVPRCDLGPHWNCWTVYEESACERRLALSFPTFRTFWVWFIWLNERDCRVSIRLNTIVRWTLCCGFVGNWWW